MHGEQHRVELGRYLASLSDKVRSTRQFGKLTDDRHRTPRPSQLKTNAKRQRATNKQHQQSGKQELDPDHLVIGGENIFADEANLVMTMIIMGVCRKVSGWI